MQKIHLFHKDRESAVSSMPVCQNQYLGHVDLLLKISLKGFNELVMYQFGENLMYIG